MSVYEQLRDAARQYQNHSFLHIPAIALTVDSEFASQGFTATYGQTLTTVELVRNAYQQMSFGIGDRVALVLDNEPAFFIHWFALNALGVSVVPINSGLTNMEMTYLLDHSNVCLVVSLERYLTTIETCLEKCSQDIEVVDQKSVIHKGNVSAQPANQNQEINLTTECAILYTSGSSGKPKGCMLSNEYFISSGQWYRDVRGICQLEKGCERLITPLPLMHMNAMACSTMGMMMTGGCVIQLDRFHPRTWWQTVRETRATVVHYLGVMPAILLGLQESDTDNFRNQIKFGFGAGVNPGHHARFEHRFGFPLVESWGMTETGCANCIAAITEPRHVGTSCIGKSPDYLDIRLIDSAGDKVVAGEPGELLVRAKGSNPKRGFFSGYYKDPQATQDIWQGGWLHTGDIVLQGHDGSLHFVDRVKNMIRRSGENISALEVEAVLSLNPCIKQIVVTAVPDEIRGEEVMACVIVKDPVKATATLAKAIFDSAAKELTYYKLPGYIAFVNALPLTVSNKPQRAELKRFACSLLQDTEVTAPSRNQHLCFDLRKAKKR